MQKLPEDYRVALYLSYFEGFSLGAAGRIMGKTEKQMYNIHARAKIALRKLLEKEGVTCEDL
jgi:RNA polymerase sigma-70 factor (ECF subfamily)